MGSKWGGRTRTSLLLSIYSCFIVNFLVGALSRRDGELSDKARVSSFSCRCALRFLLWLESWKLWSVKTVISSGTVEPVPTVRLALVLVVT